jgi:hypothetical protein
MPYSECWRSFLKTMRTLTIILFLVTLSSYGQEMNPVKLGLGIVEIQDTYNESRIVTIYRDRNLNEKIEDFRLYGKLNRIWPYFFKPDYGLCSFVCLEKTKAYFRILINDKEEGFLKNENDKHFKTWESLLINSTVERLDINSNPLKESPGDDQRAIVLTYTIKVDRLEVIDVIELKGQHWINVRFSKSGQMPCTPDCGTGWIKWREGDKLLVDILRLC